MNKKRHSISIRFNPERITINIDSSCKAVYVQFTQNKIAKTIDCSRGDEIVTVDVDENGEAVGVETIGLHSISIKQIFDSIKPYVKGIKLSQLDEAKISMPTTVAA